MRAEIGGPEDRSLTDYARQYQRARGMNRRIVPVHLSDKRARRMGFVASHGVRGKLTWADWLQRRFAGASQRAAA
jgi:hypothetical protein